MFRCFSVRRAQTVDFLSVRKISMTGSNLGSIAVLQQTGVQFFVEAQPYNARCLLF